MDNGKSLAGLRLPRESEITAVFEENLLNGVVILEADGFTASESEGLYQSHAPMLEPIKLRAIPYYAWCNRKAGEMRIWTHET